MEVQFYGSNVFSLSGIKTKTHFNPTILGLVNLLLFK